MRKRHKLQKGSRLLCAALALAAAIFLLSCGQKISGRAGILAGAAAWHSQSWDEAVLSFLPLAASPDKTISDFAAYGLALSYIEQDELEAAISRLSAIEGSSSDELRSAAWYERGICEYLLGNYGEAAACFRRSLEIESGRADAKINLELSLMQAESERKAALSSGSSRLPAAAAGGGSAAEGTIYSLMERKEIDQWKRLAERAGGAPVPDY